jgi:hypothetical protein
MDQAVKDQFATLTALVKGIQITDKAIARVRSAMERKACLSSKADFVWECGVADVRD